LQDYVVLVGVCGGIAAYKIGELVSRLVQRGAGVTVAMTGSARKFVAPLTFRTLSGRPVLTSLWGRDTPYEAQHIGVTEAADVFVIAPATANIIGKLAAGIADDLLSTLLLSADSPLILAPGMNTRMWTHPVVQENVERLRRLPGCTFVGPGEGWLACREVGVGRMAEVSEILEVVVATLRGQPPKRHRSPA